MKTWIVCADPDGARIFRDERPGGIRFHREIPHPEGQPPAAHRTNRIFANEYAKYVAEELDLAVGQGEAERLLLCAEPEFLTKMLAHLGSHAQAAVIGTVERDLYGASESDLINYVRDCRPRPAA
jgi:hypothetical protein